MRTRPGAGARLGGLLHIILLFVQRLGLAFLAGRLGSGPGLAAGSAARVTVGTGTTRAAAGSARAAAGSGLPASATRPRATAAARV